MKIERVFMSRLTNTLKMLDILSIRSVISLSELSEILEVNERTIQRMRDDLLDLGYQIETVYGPTGGLKLIGSSKIVVTDFTSNESMHIRQGLRYLSAVDSDTFGTDFYLAITKLHHLFDSSKHQRVLETIQSVKLNVDGALYQTIILKLEDSIEQQRRIRMVYQKNPRKENYYIFEPYEMLLVNQLWYVSGYEKGGRHLTLRVSRIKDIEVLDEYYREDTYYTKNHNLNDYGFKVDPIAIEVKVTNFDYLSEYIWGNNQSIQWIDDYTYILKVDFPNELSAKEFILKAGSHLEVIKPKTLRNWIQEEAKRILEIYDIDI